MTNQELSYKLDFIWHYLEETTAGMESDKKALKLVQQIQNKIVDLDIAILRHEKGAKNRKARRLQDIR